MLESTESTGATREAADVQLNWTSEELLLALDLYLRTRPHPPRDTSSDVQDLSRTLNALSIHPAEGRDPKFRSPRSVYSKLSNFLRLDGDSDWSGLSHGAAADQRVWDEFAGRPALVAELAAAIRAGVDLSRAEIEAAQRVEGDGVIEGGIVLAYHWRRERDRGIGTRKRAQFIAAHGSLFCEACGLDFIVQYGNQVGDGVAEVHHIVPLAIAGETKTSVADLAVLCANCHRAVHRLRPMEIQVLRGLLERMAVQRAGRDR